MKSILPKFTKTKKPALVILGCSFSDSTYEAYKDHNITTWPEIFQQELFPDYHVINLSKAGHSNQYACEKFLETISNSKIYEQYDIRGVVFQGTEWKRMHVTIPWNLEYNLPFIPDPGMRYLVDLHNNEIPNDDKRPASPRLEFNPIISTFTDKEKNLLDYYKVDNLKTLIDKNLIYINTVFHMCKDKNIPFLFLQFLQTTDMCSQLYRYLLISGRINNKNDPWYNFSNEYMTIRLTKYLINRSKYIQTIMYNKKYFPDAPWIHGYGVWRKYRKSHIISEKNYHPSQEGHNVLSSIAINKWKQIYEST